MEEVEIKFLNIDIPTMEEKLLSVGAEKVGEYFYRRRHFDYADESLDKKGEWIRVRDEGDKITMAHKKLLAYDKDIKVEDIVYRGDLKRKDLIGFAKEFDRTEK